MPNEGGTQPAGHRGGQLVSTIFFLLVALSAPLAHWARTKELFDTYEHWVPAILALVFGLISLRFYARRFSIFQNLSTTDELTGLPNRRHFINNLKVELSRARRYKRTVCLIILDIDYFKKVNDERGHLFGDFLVREFGWILRRTLREHDFVARYGGDEYVVVCPEIGLSDTVLVAERIRQRVAEHIFTSGRVSCQVTLSAGVAASEGKESESYQSLIGRADKALYRAKELGRDRTEVAPGFVATESPAK